MQKTLAILSSLRPYQWVKNLLLFAPLIFTERYGNFPDFFLILIAVLLWSLTSSSTYLLNDWVDVERDRKHPRKSFRSYASARISTAELAWLVIGLAGIAFFGAYFLHRGFFLVLVSYWVLSAFYTFFGQNWAIIELFLVASGYVLRVVGGAVILSELISPWILLCTFLLALTLILGKRRAELLRGEAGRAVLAQYSPALLDQWLLVSVSSAILAYAFYSFQNPHTRYLMLTLPSVFYGFFRYLQLVYAHQRGESPDVELVRDLPSLLNASIWLVLVLVAFELEKMGK